MLRLVEYSQMIPQHMTASFELLVNGESSELCHISAPLKALKIISHGCTKIATNIEAGFHGIIDMLSELMEAIIACKSNQINHRQDIKAEQKACQVRLNYLKEKHDEASKHVSDLKHEILAKEREFEKAKKAMPSNLSLLANKVLDCLNFDVFQIVRDGIHIGVKKAIHASKSRKLETHCTRESLEVARHLDNYMTELKLYVAGKDVNQDELRSNSIFKVMQILFEEEKEKLANLKENEVTTKLKDLCKVATDICDILGSYTKGANQSNSKETAAKIMETAKSCNSLHTQCAKEMKSMNAPAPPEWSEALPGIFQGKGTANARREMHENQIKMTEDILKTATSEYQTEFDALLKASESMADEIGKMAKCRAEDLKTEDIILVISRSILMLCDIKIQWGKIVSCFQSVSNILDCAINSTLAKYTSQINETVDHSPSEYSISTFRKNVLYMEVVQVACVCQQVQFIADSYADISDQYIMPQLSHLNGLLKYHPTKDRETVLEKISELSNKSLKDEREITGILSGKMEAFCAKIQRRIESVKSSIPQEITQSTEDSNERSSIHHEADATETVSTKETIDLESYL